MATGFLCGLSKYVADYTWSEPKARDDLDQRLARPANRDLWSHGFSHECTCFGSPQNVVRKKMFQTPANSANLKRPQKTYGYPFASCSTSKKIGSTWATYMRPGKTNIRVICDLLLRPSETRFRPVTTYYRSISDLCRPISDLLPTVTDLIRPVTTSCDNERHVLDQLSIRFPSFPEFRRS